MSRATISTGIIEWSSNRTLKNGEDPGYVLILGDFSGSGSRGENPKTRLLRVDRDNVEDVFARLDVRLQLPLAEDPLIFTEPDELHPDYLYQRFELFTELRSLRRRLQDRSTFAAAAAELTGGATSVPAAESVLLDELLANTQPAETGVQQLIQRIVAPYIEPAPDPQQAALLEAVDDATSELLRALLHHPHFRALEASWRGLQWWLRRVDSNTEPRVLLCDCNRAQLIDLLTPNGSLECLLAEDILGVSPPRQVLADFHFEANSSDIAAARALAEFAMRHGTYAFAGASARFAGCTNLSAMPDPIDWTSPLESATEMQWTALRQSPAALHLLLVTPRWLLRLPYGKRTSSIESFDLEELNSTVYSVIHQNLLWGNGAWLAALALYNAIYEIDSLPLYQWQEDGEVQTIGGAEVRLSDRAAATLEDAGLTTLRGVQGSDAIRLPKILTCSL